MSLFLSRLVLNPRSRQVWSELAQPYEMHKTLMRAFPKATDGAMCKARDEYGVLFRADADDQNSEVKVYVQSTVQPDWTSLSGFHGYLLREPDSQDISGFCSNLREGQVLSFRLRANPTKRIGQATSGEPSLKGKRVGLLTEEKQTEWLVRKAGEREKGKPGGFEIPAKEVVDQNGETRRIPAVNVRGEGKTMGRKREGGTPHQMTHLAVVFDGLLRITDPTAFRETLAAGIGSAKAYGFGLLSLAPIRR